MALLTWLALLTLVAWLARWLGVQASPWAALAGWVLLPIYNRWLLADCMGDCGIRIDLLVVLPVLLTLTVMALWRWIRVRRHRDRSGPG